MSRGQSEIGGTNSRGQSEVIGTVLIVAVVVLTISLFGLFSIGSLLDSSAGPLVDIEGVLSDDGLELVHQGGDVVDESALIVRIRVDGSETVTEFSDGDIIEVVTGDGRFEPGERWRNDSTLPPGDELDMLLVHESSNSVLYRETLRRSPGTTDGTPTSTPENDLPTATMAISCEGVTCEFDGGNSSDSDGTIESYEWDFGDGTVSSGEVDDHTYDDEGTYDVTLTVTDDDGATDTTTDQVSVEHLPPELTGVLAEDQSGNSNGKYRVYYDVENTAEFDRVEVEFDNLNQSWADQTIQNETASGFVDFEAGGTEGDTYEITVRAYDVEGDVTDSRTIVDVANSGEPDDNDDLGDEDSPAFEGVVFDDVSTDEAAYEVSYNVTNRTNFSHVDVTIEHLDGGWAGATYSSSEPRDNVDDYAQADNGGTFGHGFQITAEIIDDDGLVVDERNVTDTADGTDPAGNDDLSEVDSPTLESTTLTDITQYSNGRYILDYGVSDPAGKFTEAEVLFTNVDSQWASTRTTSTDTSTTTYYSTGGTEGNQYEITLRVRDHDGIIVDEYAISDQADGSVDGSDLSALTAMVNNFGAKPGQDEFNVQAEAEDDDGDNDLDRIEYVITDSAGNVVATRTEHGSGQQIQPGTITIQSDEDVQGGESYTVTVVAYDEDGNYDWARDST